ncbi:ribosomal protein S18 acetylase RimI-like enzyme [Bacillus tianshenii]|uniref:Ribosomal protein S18 acetylase RimI-like enzyme n=1 Tax=Sutcliffiella tianshenii TaxID=1463404 RepID=A0ABS2NWV0_9BACI|nr:GNAT family N-acetyltransferase [Bacillus tianshenii]MBM7619135.1 ribosomal protein S18 acetylase RimI-like enzyme [Bacillus tianshenii]
MTIKRVRLDHLKEAAHLFNLYRVYYDQKSDMEGAVNFLRERISNEESVIFLAYEQEQAVGFTQLYPTFSSVQMKRTWVLNDLFVQEEYRGHGYGEQLVRQAIEFADSRDAAGVLLETMPDNVNAQRLYEKIGFKKEENYYYFYKI